MYSVLLLKLINFFLKKKNLNINVFFGNMSKIQYKFNTPFIFSKNTYISIRNTSFNFYSILNKYKKKTNFSINKFRILNNLIFMFSKFKGYRNSFKDFCQHTPNMFPLKIYVIRLYLKGIGYKFLRVKKFNSFLRIELGYSISLYLYIPNYVRISTKRDKIIILGSNYFNVSNFSKRIFSLRPADAYKGKGVRYSNIKYNTFKPGKQR